MSDQVVEQLVDGGRASLSMLARETVTTAEEARALPPQERRAWLASEKDRIAVAKDERRLAPAQVSLVERKLDRIRDDLAESLEQGYPP